MTRLLVHVGPTLPAAEILRMAPSAEIQPPVEGWMVGRTRPRAGDVVVLIDGYYRDRPAVRHKEIMYLIEAGVTVIGAASMGALRAAELDGQGMLGVGRIYQMYKSGEICGDDEVAITHRTAEEGYLAQSVALVNLRFGAARAVAEGVVSREAAAAVIAAAKELPFDERTWPQLESSAGDCFSAEVRALARICATRSCDLKALDALAAIDYAQRLLDGAVSPPGAPPPGGAQPPAWRTAYLRDWVGYWDSAEPTEAGEWLSDSDVLNAARLFWPGYPDFHQQVMRDLLAELAGPATVAEHATALLGLDPGDSLPAPAEKLLSAAERELPYGERAVLVVCRSWPTATCRDWHPRAIERLKRQPSWGEWRDLVLAADSTRDHRSERLPEYVPGLLFLRRWDASGPVAPRELARRGFQTLTNLDAVARRFASLELGPSSDHLPGERGLDERGVA
jgi:hypothetical protein